MCFWPSLLTKKKGSFFLGNNGGMGGQDCLPWELRQELPVYHCKSPHTCD